MCIWRCEHARFCVEVFLCAIYKFSFIHSIQETSIFCRQLCIVCHLSTLSRTTNVVLYFNTLEHTSTRYKRRLTQSRLGFTRLSRFSPTSLSSIFPFVLSFMLAERRPVNPHIHYMKQLKHRYCRCRPLVVTFVY